MMKIRALRAMRLLPASVACYVGPSHAGAVPASSEEACKVLQKNLRNFRSDSPDSQMIRAGVSDILFGVWTISTPLRSRGNAQRASSMRHTSLLCMTVAAMMGTRRSAFRGS